jgi:competence protein ComEC
MEVLNALAAVPKTTVTPIYRPVIPITLALITGILLGDTLPGFAFAVLAVFLATTMRLAVCMRRDQPACWSPLLAVMAAGYLAMVPWVAPVHGADHVLHFLDSGHWRVRATVVDGPMTRLGRTRFVAAIDTLAREGAVHAVKGKIRVTVMGEVALMPGDGVAFTARLRSFHNFRNPGGFDYRRYMRFQGIHGSAWVQAEKLKIDPQRPSFSVGRLIRDARRRLGRIIDATGDGDATDEKAVLKALVFGDRSGIGEDLRRRFNRSGVGHLLAISGLHVGIVAMLAFGGFRWLFSFFTPLLWRGWGRPLAAGATLVPVLAYGLLAGMSPSTQRAVIMVAVFLASLMLGRSRDTLNTLAVAALAILVIFPPALFSISFQLSFAAVLAIVVGMQQFKITRDMADRPVRIAVTRLMGFVLVSGLAVAGTAPVVLYHFNQTSLVGIAANLLLVPLVGFVAVPLGLVSAVVAFFLEPAATIGFGLSIGIIHVGLVVVNGFAALSFAALQTVTPSLLEIVLYYLAAWALLNLRRATIAPWVLAAVLVAAVGDGFYWSYERFWHRDLKITAIDVGQGTSTLMEFPGGGVLLMDGGGFSDNRVFDMGQQVVAPLLWRKKIASVDILALSHPDADHLNGLIHIARHFHVRELWTNGDANTTWGYQELMAACRERGIVVRAMDAGMGDTGFGGVTLSVLHPAAGYAAQVQPDDQDGCNNASLVVKAIFGETAFLLTGDIMAKAEKALVQRAGGRLACTVLFAPHHGSRTSSSSGLIAAVKPEVVVISAGMDNRFGFPHDEVMRRYREAGCRILCTCTHGAILLSSDGKQIDCTTYATP